MPPNASGKDGDRRTGRSRFRGDRPGCSRPRSQRRRAGVDWVAVPFGPGRRLGHGCSPTARWGLPLGRRDGPGLDCGARDDPPSGRRPGDSRGLRLCDIGLSRGRDVGVAARADGPAVASRWRRRRSCPAIAIRRQRVKPEPGSRVLVVPVTVSLSTLEPATIGTVPGPGCSDLGFDESRHCLGPHSADRHVNAVRVEPLRVLVRQLVEVSEAVPWVFRDALLQGGVY